MAVRTTDSAVQGIIETDPNISLTPFIETASFLVDKLLVDATDSDGNPIHDATSLELVERWLSAHYYAIRDIRPASEKAGPVSENKMYKVDLNLAVTIYGQQAMTIDISGLLAAWNDDITKGSTKKASVSWAGKDPNSTLGNNT